MNLDDLREEARVRWLLASPEIKQMLMALAISAAALIFNVVSILIDNRFRQPRTSEL